MDQKVSGEHDIIEVDIEAGLLSTSDIVSGNVVRSDLNYPLMGTAETSSQSLDKKSRKASKPPRPPKGPSLSANDHKLIREIAELAIRKRERIERMKNSLRRIKAAKSSSPSPCVGIFSLIVTILFFIVLVFQGSLAGNSSLSSDKSLAPTVSPNNQLISVQFYNEFAPAEQTDPRPTSLFRYPRTRLSGAEEEEQESREFTRYV